MSRVLALFPLMLACGEPVHMQYDFGRSYTEAFSAQADLERPSVEDAAYSLSGEEGLKLRQQVVEKSSDEESGQAEVIDKK